jgi:hypothetical protein
LAVSKNARLTVYLRGTDETGAKGYGDPALLERVSKRVQLQIRVVPSAGDRLLHAKLVAARTDGVWSLTTGSPNATGSGFVTPHGNVELASEFRNVGKALPRGLLPASRPIRLGAVVRPEVTEPRARWECLESATYNPRRKKLVLRWKSGHGLFDSRVLLEDRDLVPNNVDLSKIQDRFLKTIPRGATRLKYEPDFVPIDVPDEEPDLIQDYVAESMTPDDWLARLESAGRLGNEVTDQPGGRGRSANRKVREDSQRFPWRQRVLMLHQRLRGFAAALDDAYTKRDVNYLRKIAIGVWRAHEPAEPGLTTELRAWHIWVRAGLWQVLHTIDRRDKLGRPLSALAARWKRKVPSSLREFKIA